MPQLIRDLQLHFDCWNRCQSLLHRDWISYSFLGGYLPPIPPGFKRLPGFFTTKNYFIIKQLHSLHYAVCDDKGRKSFATATIIS